MDLKTFLIKVALEYIKLYNLREEDIIIINGYVEEVLSRLPENKDDNQEDN